MGPHPAVAAVRSAVRRALVDQAAHEPVLVACSGGPDSLALASAVAFEVGRGTVRSAALVTVDHGLQYGSDVRAKTVAEIGFQLGFDPVHAVRVVVDTAGGPEAAARRARYAAIEQVRGDATVLLGHTADDQAETVLLGLGRGSGPRSLAGMKLRSGHYLRPLLAVRRHQTVAACSALGLPVWDDPHNLDPRYRRVRVRHEVLPLLEDVLAGGVVEALGRTASMLQRDCDALDAIAADALAESRTESGLSVSVLVSCHDAVLSRVLRGWVAELEGGATTGAHIEALLSLVRDWHGQGPVGLPGGYSAYRTSGRLGELRLAEPPASQAPFILE